MNITLNSLALASPSSIETCLHKLYEILEKAHSMNIGGHEETKEMFCVGSWWEGKIKLIM